MQKISCIITVLIFFAGLQTTAHAAKRVNTAKIEKERMVLMPLRVPDEDKSLQGSMETALAQGLQQKYEVFSGEQVAQKAKAIFLKESRVTTKKECDETRCMQDIAAAFQAELIATANIAKRADGYFLSLSIQNIFDNKVIYSNSVACKNCDAYQVVDQLKVLVATTRIDITETHQQQLKPTNITLPPIPSAPHVTGNANDVETQVWTEMVAGNKIADYKFYLDNYPQGKYARQAKSQKQRLEAYSKASADAVFTQENEQAWSAAQQGNSVKSYTQYLSQFPNGPYAPLAKIKKNKAAIAEEAAAIEAARAPEAIAISGIQASFVPIPGKNYELGKFEVTQAEWRIIMGNDPSQFQGCGDKCPVDKVSWHDIQKFLQKLNTKTGKQYRLPTEAEWEYACYGGSLTEYCGSNDMNTVAWYEKNSSKTTHPVGQKQANGYGLYDMSGNVWEWQSDCYDADCTMRTLRGGSWDNSAFDARAVLHDVNEPSDRNYYSGFRLARTLP